MKVRTFLVAVVGALSLLSAFGFVEELYLQEWAGGDRPLPGGWTHKKLIKGDGARISAQGRDGCNRRSLMPRFGR